MVRLGLAVLNANRSSTGSLHIMALQSLINDFYIYTATEWVISVTSQLYITNPYGSSTDITTITSSTHHNQHKGFLMKVNDFQNILIIYIEESFYRIWQHISTALHCFHDLVKYKIPDLFNKIVKFDVSV